MTTTEFIATILSLVIPLVSAIVGLFIWTIKMIKRNRKVCEVANQMNTIIEMIANREIKTEPKVAKICKKICKKFSKLDLTPLQESEI